MDKQAATLIFEAGDSNFEALVLDRSMETPVVVDFWAEWCGPCKTLGPLLERLTTEHGGKFLLATINVDQSPQLASAFGVQSIPMVFGFRGGKAVASFVGAQPEAAIRGFLARVLPSPAEELVAEASKLLSSGDRVAAGAKLRDALDSDPRCDAALLALARLAIEREDTEEALELLERVTPGTPERHEADRMAAQIRVGAAGGADAGELEQRLASDPNDHQTRYALAQTLAATSKYREALGHYLEIVKRDRSFHDDAGRKAMLDIFELLGSDHVLTEQYRGELAKVLFS